MSIFSVLEERANPPAGDDFWYEPTTRYRNIGNITPSTALTSTPVWAAVNLISNTIGSMPCILYRELDDGGTGATMSGAKERARDLPLYNMLRWQPNSWQSAMDYFAMSTGHLLLRGNSFSRLEVNRADELTAIVPLHPDKMKLKVLSDGTIEYHYTEGAGQPRVFSAEQILHVRGLSSDGLIGYSPITIGAGAVAMNQAAENYGLRFYQNSATPSGILSHPGKLKPESRDNIRKSWQSAHAGSKQNSVALLEEGLSFTAMSANPEEAQALEFRRYSCEEIARLFNCPPHLLQVLERATFSNVTEQNRSFATNCIRPWSIRWEQAIRNSILERFVEAGTFAEFLMDALLRPDTMARAQANQIMLHAGALTIDEWRAMENRNPLESERAGSTHWMPLNIAPVGVAEAGPAGEAEASRKLAKELRSHGFEVPDDMGHLALRSIADRKRIADATRPLIRNAAERLIKREVKTVRRMMKRQLRAADGHELRGSDGLFAELETFYHGPFTDIIAEAMLPVMRSYARQIYTQASIEVGYPPEFTDELEEFIREYCATASRHHAMNSRQQLQSIISATHFDEIINELEIRLAEWLDNRAEKVARRNTTEGNGAFAKFAYIAAGVLTLRWVTTGLETCPFCRKLSGATVGIQTAFVQSGQTVQSDAGDLVPRRTIGHPPLHSGCDCFISPGG